eukprot:COSAG02_NODE_380_length_23483_cov_8.034382_21_plen_180_part_00
MLRRYDRSRVSLVQRAADGTEFVLVNAIELDYLEEFGHEHGAQAAIGTELSWADTMEFLDELLEHGTQPDQILAHSWRSGQLVICERLSVHMSKFALTRVVAPVHACRSKIVECPAKHAGDNRSVFHSPTPYASHPDGTPSYASLPEPQGRRLMARTFLTSDSWEPTSRLWQSGAASAV